MTIYDILILTDGTQEVEIWLKEKYDKYRKHERNYVYNIMKDEDFTNKLKKAIRAFSAT